MGKHRHKTVKSQPIYRFSRWVRQSTTICKADGQDCPLDVRWEPSDPPKPEVDRSAVKTVKEELDRLDRRREFKREMARLEMIK